jgi:hypothetical protein
MNPKYSKLWIEGYRNPNSVVGCLKDILRSWEEKEYPSDKARWEEYAKDIASLIDYYSSDV